MGAEPQAIWMETWEKVETSALGEDEVVRLYRKANPKSRAVALTQWSYCSQRVKQRSCILCGEVGPTWSARHAMTVKAKNWECEHRVKHGLIPRVWIRGLAMMKDAKGKWVPK